MALKLKRKRLDRDKACSLSEPFDEPPHHPKAETNALELREDFYAVDNEQVFLYHIAETLNAFPEAFELIAESMIQGRNTDQITEPTDNINTIAYEK